MASKEEILDSISSMTVLELSELLKEFETRFDVTAAAPTAVAVAAPGSAEAVEEEEKTEFNVMLHSCWRQESSGDQGSARSHHSGPQRG